ncbi:murein transglycosylase A [Kiloniella antarctica]|uniref:peptidoglycan lytic exotransglycosylase n=1 Tax=Kiloniella antarctica TaxID=1550907 RepID=A0ABW5BFI3_9PROT
MSFKDFSITPRTWFGRPLLIAVVSVLLVSCDQVVKKPAPTGTLKDKITLSKIAFPDLPGWQDDKVVEAFPALSKSCIRYARWPDDKTVGPDAIAGTAADWKIICASLSDFMAHPENHKDFGVWLEENFVPFLVKNNDDQEGLFTGYYEAELKGSFIQDEIYKYPLYDVPKDLVSVRLSDFDEQLKGTTLVGKIKDNRLVPYHERTEIESGVLNDQGLEVIWSDDPVDVFFLHVQGSGRVMLPSGEVIRVGYAGNNGHKFYAIGRALIDEEIIPRDKVSMQAIRTWLRENPERANEIMQRNKRFIFFRQITGEGPIGAMGVALTPERSLAVDPRHIPLGVPLWLDTTWPGTDEPLQRLMVAQDTGSAITGPVRGDFFWGPGEPALAQAGKMKQKGRYYLLLPKAVAQNHEISG